MLFLEGYAHTLSGHSTSIQQRWTNHKESMRMLHLVCHWICPPIPKSHLRYQRKIPGGNEDRPPASRPQGVRSHRPVQVALYSLSVIDWEHWSQSVEELRQPLSHPNLPCESPIINPRFPSFTANRYIELKNSALAHGITHYEGRSVRHGYHWWAN